MDKLQQLTINTIRLLCADTVQKANSGHPGLPLGAAPAAFALWSENMKHSPANPNWKDRDRFVLSAGHGSSLLYSLLHLFGYEDNGEQAVSMDDLKAFRQFNSKTPGHPEYRHTVGIEVTTGPLGQGIANAVGMAMAEAHLAAKFNKPGFEIVNHFTYALCGDGCLQEGISSEACSLAGTLGLGKLILLYDSNNITIEGDTDIAFRENVLKRFEAYGWHTALVGDGNDITAINRALIEAKAVLDKPTIIEIKTKIGYGSPNKQGKASAHGEPLGADELKLTKQNLGFNPDESFYVPDEVKGYLSEIKSKLAKKEAEWDLLITKYKKEHPGLYDEWELWFSDKLPVDLLNLEELWSHEGATATRLSSEKILNIICNHIPNLIGGSADLSPSTKTIMKGMGDFSAQDYSGRNLHFGIREHAMTAIANGMAVHGGLRAYIAGFFVFSDYMKPSMRLSALMKLPVISVMTHDSIGVGEDGPTHQPIEQLAALRSIPNYTVIRPCDTNETASAWYLALTRTDSPTSIVLTRQNTALLPETGKGALRGAYILKDSVKPLPDIILIASGSEVELIYSAWDILKEKGVDARVVSMPSFEIFEEQINEYKESILPKQVTKRLAVEAACSFGWDRYVGFEGRIISIDVFGMSAPANELFKEYGFTVDNVVKTVLDLLGL